jgi:hypothetical protein
MICHAVTLSAAPAEAIQPRRINSQRWRNAICSPSHPSRGSTTGTTAAPMVGTSTTTTPAVRAVTQVCRTIHQQQGQTRWEARRQASTRQSYLLLPPPPQQQCAPATATWQQPPPPMNITSLMAVMRPTMPMMPPVPYQALYHVGQQFGPNPPVTVPPAPPMPQQGTMMMPYYAQYQQPPPF